MQCMLGDLTLKAGRSGDDMKSKIRELRRLIREVVNDLDPENPSTWPQGWVTDVIANVMSDIEENRHATANIPFASQRVFENTLSYMGLSEARASLVAMLAFEAVFSPDNWARRIGSHGKPTGLAPVHILQEANAIAQRAYPLVKSRDGSEFEFEHVEVMIQDVDGHVAHTLDDNSDVWAFDLETLELLYVPTVKELWHQPTDRGRALPGKVLFAKRKHIEGGDIG